MTVTDPNATEDTLPDDEGGVLFDDDFDDGAPEEPGDRGSVPGAPAYDSGKILQARGIAYPNATPIGMKQLYAFLSGRWGGKNLGILSKPPRPMRGGSQPSLHCWGMALDWSWEGPGRPAADQVIEFLLANAGPLAIQAVHDYERCRYWKSYNGWNTAKKSTESGFGQPWSRWLHVERTWAAANDGRTIDEALRAGGGQAPTGGGATTTANGGSPLPDPTISAGTRGANVSLLQDFLRAHGFADFSRSDGEYGPRTVQAVKNAQTDFAGRGWYSGGIGGEYGPRTHAAAVKLLQVTALPDPSISAGATGPKVAQLQDFLRAHGYADFSRSDGEYGPRTAQAVKKAQTDFAGKGWYSAGIDGEYGPGTHAAAVKLLQGG